MPTFVSTASRASATFLCATECNGPFCGSLEGCAGRSATRLSRPPGNWVGIHAGLYLMSALAEFRLHAGQHGGHPLQQRGLLLDHADELHPVGPQRLLVVGLLLDDVLERVDLLVVEV